MDYIAKAEKGQFMALTKLKTHHLKGLCLSFETIIKMCYQLQYTYGC